MLFSKSATGMEVSSGKVTFAQVGGAVNSPRLDKVSSCPLPDNTMRTSVRERNVLDPESFVDCIRSAHNLLLTRNNGVFVTLPDSIGRIMLLDLEGRFKSRKEALDLIRWKLKKNIPFDPADTHLDYQLLSVRENGDLALLVVIVSRAIISQYEELLVKAGLTPVSIDFNSFNLCRVFDSRLSLKEDSILISFYSGILVIMANFQGTPEFVRIKDLSGTIAVDRRMFMEINSSLLTYRERFPDRTSQELFCAAPPNIARDFQEMAAEAAGLSPTLLEIKNFVTSGANAPEAQETLYPYTAAVGAALRGL